MQRLVNRETSHEVRYYKLNDGRVISIEINDNEILVRDSSDKNIGTIKMRHIEHDAGVEHRVTELAIDKYQQTYKRCGIGRECLVFYKEYWDCDLFAAEMLQHSSEDGSHLIHDGRPFLKKMREEGIVVSEPASADDGD